MTKTAQQRDQERKEIEQILDKKLPSMENMLWSFEAEFTNVKINWSDEAVKGACKVFMAFILSRMWEKQEAMDKSKQERMMEAIAIGKKVRALVFEATGLDTVEMYK